MPRDPTIEGAGERRGAIVFDLDGTLVDSLPDIIDSFRAAFERHGWEAPSERSIGQLIGQPLETMARAFRSDEGEVEAVCAAYREIYPQRFTRRTRPFPGVLDVLAELRAQGWKLAVATTKRTSMAERLVSAVGLREAIDHVQGTDGFPHKPAPDVVLRALEALRAEGAWMVGDTVGDLQAGRAAGLRTYGVTWGTHPRPRLAEADPDVLEDDLGPLPALAGRYPGA